MAERGISVEMLQHGQGEEQGSSSQIMKASDIQNVGLSLKTDNTSFQRSPSGKTSSGRTPVAGNTSPAVVIGALAGSDDGSESPYTSGVGRVRRIVGEGQPHGHGVHLHGHVTVLSTDGNGAYARKPSTLPSSSARDSPDSDSSSGHQQRKSLLDGPEEKGYTDKAFWAQDEERKSGGCRYACSRFLTNQVTAFGYMKAEIQRQPKSYALGWFTVFLTVFFCALLINSVVRSPLIFFRFSEVQAGEQDVIITPGRGIVEKTAIYPEPIPLLNGTKYLQAVEYANHNIGPHVLGVANRWIIPASVMIRNNESVYNSTDPSLSVFAVGIDTAHEASIHLGRTWIRPPVPVDAVYLMRTILYQLNVDPEQALNKIIHLEIAPASLLSKFGASGNTDAAIQRSLLMLLQPNTTWTEVFARPVIDPSRDTINASAIFDPTPVFNALLAQVDPAIQPLITQLNVTYTFDQLNEIFKQAFTGMIPVTLSNGRIIELNATSLNPPLPSSNRTIIAQLNRVHPNNFTLNRELYDKTFNESLQEAGPSKATYGEYLDFIAPITMGNLLVDRALRIGDVIVESDGKFPDSIGSIAVTETPSLFSFIVEQFVTAAYANTSITPPTNITINPNEFVTLPFGIVLNNFTLPGSTFTFNVSVLSLLQLTGLNETAARQAIDTSVASLTNANINDFTPTGAGMYRYRLEAYLSSEKPLNNHMIAFTNTLATAVGIDTPARHEMPLLTAMKATLVMRYFLDNIFGSVIVFICFLSALLIYSLLLNDVETKTYEYGMLRALGMTKGNLIQLLLSKSLLFSTLGIGTGFLMAYLIGIPVTGLMHDYASVDHDYRLGIESLMAALAIGIVMPLLANVVPISRALSKTLRDSLDIYHHVVSDIYVRVIRLADLGLDLWQTAISILMVLIGFVTYYLVPYAFTYNNIPMFLGLLNAILIGMLIGLCIIAQLIEPYFERVFLWLMTRPFHSNLYALIRKNLSAHRGRNAKTAQMFTLALAFVVFAGVMFALQATSLADNLRILQGAPLVVRSTSTLTPLPEAEITPFLEHELARGAITGYTFITFPLNKLRYAGNTFFSNLPFTPEQRQNVFGLQPSFYSAIYTDYYEDIETATYGRVGVSGLFDNGAGRLPEEEEAGLRIPLPTGSAFRGMSVAERYTRENQKDWAERQKQLNSSYTNYVDVVISEGLRDVVSVDTRTAAGLRLAAGGRNLQYLCKVRAMSRHVPGFFFSSYPTIVNLGAVLVSETQFVRMLNAATAGRAPTINRAPKERLLINFRGGTTTSNRRDISNGLRPYLDSDLTSITDTESTIESAQFAIEMLNLFFSIVGALAMVLCFVILWLSFTANVQENAWEFGVLRAVGLNTFQVIIIYVFEALSLVFACLVLGTAIGILVAITLTLQFNLFTEVRFKMEFPVMLYAIEISMAFAVAILASVLPAYDFVKRSVAEILRRT